MRWLKRRRRKGADMDAHCAEARRALYRQEESLREVRRDDREILATVERLKRLGAENDFAAKIQRALGGAG